jgi:hypothetical protein
MITQNARKESSTLADIPAGSRVSISPQFLFDPVCNVKKNTDNRAIAEFFL